MSFLRADDKATPANAGSDGVARAARRTDWYGDPLPPEAVARLGTVRFRSEDYYRSLAYTPDGRHLVSGGTGGARIWDAASGKLVRQLGTDLPQPWDAADLSPDGKLVAVGGWGRRQGGGVYEIATGRQLYRFGFPSIPVTGTFSPDGKILAAYPRNDSTIALLNAANGRELRTLKAPFGALDLSPTSPQVVFSPDSRTAISSGADGFIRIWDVTNGKELRQVRASADGVSCMALSPDGGSLATVGLTKLNRGGGGSSIFPDNRVRVWDVASGKKTCEFLTPADKTPEDGRVFGPNGVAFGPDGKTLVTFGWAQALRVWDSVNGKVLRVLDRRPGVSGAFAVAFATGGKTFAMGDGRSIRLRDFTSGRDLAPAGGHRDAIQVASIAGDGRTIATGGDDGAVILWDLASGRERRLHGHSDAVHFVAFAPDGASLYSAGRDETFRAWNVATGRELRCLKRPEFSSRPTLSSDGGIIAVRGAKDGLLLLDVATGMVRRTLKAPAAHLAGLKFTPDGGTLLGWSSDGKLHHWNTATGQHQAQDFYRLENLPFGVAFSPDGRLVSFGVQNSTFLPVVDLRTGREVCRFALDQHDGHTLVWVAFSPDSRTLAWGGPGDTVRIGEVASGQVRRQFLGHRGRVQALAWSVDSKYLVSGGEDTTALVWDLTLPPEGHVRPLAEPDLATCWTDLARADAAHAYASMRRLAADPERASAYLARRLQPAAKIDPRQAALLIARLEENRFGERDKAAREIVRLGDAVLPILQQALEKKPSLEARLRIERLVKDLERLGSEGLRQLRAVEVLESIATQAAQKALQDLAQGAPGARLTREAIASLGRQPGSKLFNGENLDGWKFRGGKDAAKRSKWSVVGGVMLSANMDTRFDSKPGTGVLLSGDDGRGVDLLSEVEHGDCELHVEFNVPRGSNSGIYFQGQYEVQILDSYGKKDKDLKYGDCGGIYNTAAPKTNASLAPGEWQTFDIVFRAPRFDASGKKIANARFLKVVHNGKTIHENVEVKGPTTASLGGAERPLGPLMIQGDHGPVALRNIVLRKSGGE
jgi:WD40 repeat protein